MVVVVVIVVVVLVVVSYPSCRLVPVLGLVFVLDLVLAF